MDEPTLDKAEFTFSQEGNTLGTTEEYEQIKINLEFQLPEDDPFIVIRTDGWSIDSLDDIQKLVDRAKLVLKNK
jgi:hypothetical protein